MCFTLAISLLCLAGFAVDHGHAKTFTECLNRDIGFIDNTNEGCAYTWIYCNGDSSMYCSDTTCDEAYECEELPITTTTTTATTATTEPNTPPNNGMFTLPTAIAPAPIPIVTMTTVAPPLPTPTPTTTTPSSLRTTTARSARRRCRKGVYAYYPYRYNYNYYYQCVNGYLFVQQCPFRFTYNPSRNLCESHNSK